MKYYKLAKELPTFKAGEKFRLNDNGNLYYYPADNGAREVHWSDKIMAYHHKTLEKFPNILEEWFEEVKEPKTPERYWFINDLTGEPVIVDCSKYSGLHNYKKSIIFKKQISNYFENKKEAELAVRKLQAWKRLKDKGFRFDGWDENHHNLGIIEFSFDKVENNVWDFKEDLDLLFSQEDD